MCGCKITHFDLRRQCFSSALPLPLLVFSPLERPLGGPIYVLASSGLRLEHSPFVLAELTVVFLLASQKILRPT